MRLLLVNQHYPPDSGATGRVLAELAEALAARQHGVRVITGKPTYQEAQGVDAPWSEEKNGVQIERVPMLPRQTSRLGRMLHYASFACGLFFRGLTLPRPDAVVAFSSTPFLGGVALRMLAFAKRCPYVYVVQDAYPEIAVALGALSPGFVERIAAQFERWVWSGASRVVVIGAELVSLAEARGVDPSRVAVIPNWADAERIVPQDISSFRRELGFQEDDFVVEYAGNLGQAQALEGVLEAARLVAKERRPIRFLFVGEGSSADSFRQRASSVPGVTVAPFQPEERLPDVLAAADVGLVPLKRGLSRYCVPSKVYSILASGRAVGAAVDDGSDIARLVNEADCGFRVDPDDPEGLAAEILRLADDRDQVRDMGRRARKFCEEEATLERAAERYEDVLSGAIVNQGP